MLISEHLDVTIVLISAYTNELKCGAKFISSDWPFAAGLEWIVELIANTIWVCLPPVQCQELRIYTKWLVYKWAPAHQRMWLERGSVSVACRAGRPPPTPIF